MNNYDLDIITPIELNPEFATAKEVADSVIWQYKRFGVKRFAFFALSKGFRSIGYPPREEYIRCANMVKEVKELTIDYDVEFGWFMALTLKSGASDVFTSPVRMDGSNHPFSSCPLDPLFQKRLSEDLSEYAKIAQPEFIFTEDDFSLAAVSGCFCENHLNEFAKHMGRFYSREELVKIFREKTEESYEILRKWRELSKDSLVLLAKSLRTALDKVNPEIKLGYMQAGGADIDGDATEEVSRAMAGDRHTPYSRLFGAFYSGVDAKRIPEELYHPLYSRQHIGENFKFYHETDAFPHNKFYTSSAHLKAMLGTVFSYGFDGSLFFMSGLSLVSEKATETAYGDMYAREMKRFNEVYRTSKRCSLKGVEIDYDPFYNTADGLSQTTSPLWVKSISRFGIPFTTLHSSVAFWDLRDAKHADHNTIMKRLSEGLFLDGDAAKCLCDRGYAEYLGVNIGEDVIAGTKLYYDIDAAEVLRDKFFPEDKGNRMPCAHMFAPGGTGKWLKMDIIDENCEIVSEAFTFQNKLITPTMTRYENKLGGKVVVMSLTLDGNNSQSLYNYDRQSIIQKLLSWCCDEYIYVKNIPDMSIIVNEANDCNFTGMITMVNLCEDKLTKAELHLPEKWKDVKKVTALDENAEWKEISFEKTSDGISINTDFEYLSPIYLKFS